MAQLSVVYRPPAALKPHPRNARKHSADQIERLAYSIERFGWTNPVLCDDRERIVAGHGRVLAAQKLGMDKVPVIFLGKMSDEEVRAYILADNRLAELAEWDDNLLRLELGELVDFEGLHELGLAEMAKAEVNTDDIVLEPLDTSDVGDTFWVVITGPLAQQAHVLQVMREQTRDLQGVKVELGTTTAMGEE